MKSETKKNDTDKKNLFLACKLKANKPVDEIILIMGQYRCK